MAIAAKLRRRTLLQLLAAGAVGAGTLTLLPTAVAAKSSSAKIAAVSAGKLGVTLTLKLTNAPFPAGGKPYGDPTVLVFVPKYYRLPKNRRIDMVVHFHGHNTTTKVSMQRHQLREQFFDSKQNGILIMPQGPVHASDSSAGRLERRKGLKKMLTEVLRVMRSHKGGQALGKASVAGNKGVGHLCVSAHSGGYRAAAYAVSVGGVAVKEVYLFDALYGKVDTFRRWVVATKSKKGRQRHKLISYYAGGAVRKNNLTLLKKLEKAHVRCVHESKPGTISRDDMVKGSAIFIASPLRHGQVTFSHNNLRDCLFASGMKRHIRSNWFRNKKAPRIIDHRAG